MFPIILENMRLEATSALRPLKADACSMESRPSIVIGQLFTALALTVIIRLGTSNDRTDGSIKSRVMKFAYGSMAPAFLIIRKMVNRKIATETTAFENASLHPQRQRVCFGSARQASLSTLWRNYAELSLVLSSIQTVLL